jgi:predicted nucleic acid-binding Zn ribbon protein
MIIEKMPTGLNIISSEVGPPEASAASEKFGEKLNERNVKKKMLSLFNIFIMLPLFIALETTNIYFL